MIRYIWQRAQWPNFTWNSGSIVGVLGRCNYKRGKLLGRVASLGLDHSLEARLEVMAAEVLETSAIEGKSLVPDAVRSSLAGRLGLSGGGVVKPDRYTEGLVDVLLDATLNYQQPLTIERLHGWQAALFPVGYSGIRQIVTGNFRQSPMQVVSGVLGKEKLHYQAPDHRDLPDQMELFLNWWEGDSRNLDGIIRAAIAGFWFVTIHPYDDGNGRIARAITDMALAQDEQLSARYYSISSQIMTERKNYYAILEQSQKGDLDITAWLMWFLGCLERAIDRSDNLVGVVLLKARFWAVHSQVELNQRQRKAINRLLDAGPGGFVGGLTNRKYAALTRTSKTTSYRELTDLVEKKILVRNPGGGRSVSYDLIWPD